MWSGYGDHVGFMSLWWLLGIVLIVLLVWAISRGAGPAGLGTREESPEAILKRRYARGEVDRDEYERRLSDLRK